MVEEEDIQMPLQQPSIVGHTTEGALQYQLESQETANRIQHIINGEVQEWCEDGENMRWVQKFKPMVNREGLSMIMGYLTLYLGGTKTFALSDLNEDYILAEAQSVGQNLIDELHDNWDKYEVKDMNSASFIVRSVTSAVHAVLKKGENAKYLKFLSTTQQISEIQHHQPNSNANSEVDRKGILGAVFGRKRR